jgi:HK97 family phage major capsid protein
MAETTEHTVALDELKTSVHALTEAVEGYKKDSVDRSTVENIVTDLLEKQAQADEKAPRRSVTPSDTVVEALGKTGVARLEALHSTPARAIAPLVRESREDIERFQKAGDELLMISAIKGVKPAETSYYEESFRPTIGAALNTDNANEGADWVPTGLSPSLIDRVELQLKVLALFADQPMPTNPFVLPGRSVSRVKLARGVQNDADTGQTGVKKIQIATRKVTMTAKKFWGEALVSKEAEEDAIVAMLPLMEDELTRYLLFDLEDTAINGDTAAAQDTAAGFYASDDPLRNWDGLRKIALAGAKTDFANAKLTVSGLRGNRKVMGKYGVDPAELAHILSINEYIDILDDTSVLTLEKYGPQATILKGELGSVDSVPLIVSEKMHVDLNATGIYDNVTTNRTEAITVYRPGFRTGSRRGLTLEILRELYSEYDQDAVKISVRRAFAPVQPAATEKIVAITYNVKT